MKKFLILILILCVLFSSCSLEFGTSKHSNTGPEIDTTGNGLNVNFRLDTQNIKTGRLMYEFLVENTGSNIIDLNQNNLKLKFDSYEGKPIITDESLEAFYTKVLGSEGNVKLYQNMKFEQGGILKIDENFLKSQTINNFNLQLQVNYPYKTDFMTNLDVDIQYGMHKIVSGASFEQASPIQVNNVKLVPDYEDKKYILEVEINDKGNRGNINTLTDKGIEIKNFQINFGTQSLNCNVKKEIGKESSDSMFVRKNSKLVLECPLKIDEEKRFTTQVTGSFDYDYFSLNDIKISIPKDVR